MKLGWTYPERRKFLDDALKNAPSRTMEIDFQNRKNTPIPILTLDIEFPKYRLANGRTYDLQYEYLAKNPDVAPDFFDKDPELENVQIVQHDLLKDLIGKKDLYEYFTKHEQDEPLILDHDGFVVNGNRRLCAMNELLESDSSKYSHFRHIDCAILPPATEEDIDELEARLQEHPDIKAPYEWTARVLMYKKRKEQRGYDDQKLSEIYETTIPELKQLYQMLASAEAYLKSRGKDGQYTHAHDEYSFQQITKFRPKLDDPADRDLFENTAYCLIENSSDVLGRVYEKIPAIYKNFDKIKNSLREMIESSDDTPSVIKHFEALGDLIVEDKEIEQFVSDPKNSSSIKDVVVDVIESERTRNREDKKLNASGYLISEAKSRLEAAIPQLNSLGPSKLRKVSSDIDSIDESVTTIRKWLSDNS